MQYYKVDKSRIKNFLYNGLFEGFIACLAVVSLVWVITEIAICSSKKTNVVQFEGDSEEIILSPYNASIVGKLQQSPMELEQQRHNFSYMYGRELLKERKARYISHWADKEVKLNWELDVAYVGTYQILVKHYADNEVGGVGEFMCGNQRLIFDIQEDDTKDSLKSNVIGEVNIEKAGPYHCTLKALEISGASFIQFKGIVFQKTKSH